MRADNLIDVLYGALAGVTHFETDYPLELAQKGLCLPGNFKHHANSFEQLADGQPDSLRKDPALLLAVALGKLKQKLVDPSQKEYAHSTVSQECGCYTCAHSSMAYLHHLHNVKEMNFNILCGMHNAYVFDQLFWFLKEGPRDHLVARVS